MMMGNEPEPKLPALIKFEKGQLSETAAIKFSQPDWQKIERPRKDFAWCRWAEPQAIKYRPFESQAEGDRERRGMLLWCCSH